MPNSKKRKISNYQRIQARNRKDAVNLVNEAFVTGVYEEALPQRQEYLPLTRRESKHFKPHASQLQKPSRIARLTEIPRGGLREGARFKALDGAVYVSQRGGLRRIRDDVRLKKAA